MTGEDWSISLDEALDRYIEDSPWLAERTRGDYRNAVRRFEAVILKAEGVSPCFDLINSHTISVFQRTRAAENIRHVNINKDVGVVRTLLKWAGLWSKNVARYRSLRPDPPRDEYVPNKADLEKLVRVGVTHARWTVALWTTVLSANTGMGPQEIRFLKVRDILLLDDPSGEGSYVAVRRKCKTVFRERRLPLNPNAWTAVRRLLERLKKLGFGAPDDYILPHRLAVAVGRHSEERFDPSRPIGHWNTGWRGLLKAAGLPPMRRYILRHCFASELNEVEGLSQITKLRLMGHSSRSPLLEKTYTHVTDKAKRRAVDPLAIEVPGVLNRAVTASVSSGEEIDAAFVKKAEASLLRVIDPLVSEMERQRIRSVLTASQQPFPLTPGAYLHPELNLERMWSQIDRTQTDGCWIWKGPVMGNGRAGALWMGTKTLPARRVIYELVMDDALPSDKVRLYPSCRTPMCVNPQHMLVGQRPAALSGAGGGK